MEPSTPTPTRPPRPTMTPTATAPADCQYLSVEATDGWTTFATGADGAPTFQACTASWDGTTLLAGSATLPEGEVAANALLRWDTSALVPSGLVVAAAWLRLP